MTRPEDSPWAVEVARLGSRPGQSQRFDASFPAPSGIGDEVIGIPEGTPVRVEGNFDSIVDGLILSAHISSPAHAQCSRCLTPIRRTWGSDVTAFFPYESKNAATVNTAGSNQHRSDDVEIVAGEDESEDLYPLSPDGAFADMENLLRDTLVEVLPLQPLCRPDCRGLCPQCGMNLNEHPEHHHDVVDNRFAALAELKTQLEHQQQGQQ